MSKKSKRMNRRNRHDVGRARGTNGTDDFIGFWNAHRVEEGRHPAILALALFGERIKGPPIARLLTVAGIDKKTGEGRITAESAMAAFNALSGTRDAATLADERLASFARIPTRPVAWLSNILRRLGVRLESHQTHTGERFYTVVQKAA